MSAIRVPQPSAFRAVIIKLYHNNYTLDPYSDRLYSHDYDVINTTNYANTLKAAHEYKPGLIIVHDDPAASVDALEWLRMQHMDRDARLAMVPLIILANPPRLPALHREEQPDRVIVLQNRADTLNHLTRTVKRVLHVWEMDRPPN